MIRLDAVRAKLRDYQVAKLDDLIRWGRGLNYLDMGMGKTVITLVATEEQEALPCLVTCTKFALYVWVDEIEKWLGKKSIVYSGNKKKRDKAWKEYMTGDYQYLIANYAMIEEISVRCAEISYQWGCIIADEIHTGGLFNHKNDISVVFQRFTRDIPVKYLLTGTPMRQGCVDFYNPLHIIDRNRFRAYWPYVGKYCITIKDAFGTCIERRPKNVKEFREMLSEYMVRLTKKDTPGKQRQAIPLEMNEEQARVYMELTHNWYAELFPFVEQEIPTELDELLEWEEHWMTAQRENPDMIVVPNIITLRTRQRQLLAVPQVLGLKDRGAAIDAMIDMSESIMHDGGNIAVFTPYRQGLPFIWRALKEAYPNCHIYEIKGGMSAEEFRDAWKGFQEDKYKQKVLLCVIKSGASFTATAASTGFFLGYELDFNLDEQAEDRLNRIGQTEFVNIYYFTHKGTVDYDMCNILNDKKQASNWILGTDEELAQMMEKLRNPQMTT